MPRVVGIDPGTLSFDFCGLEDGRPFLASSLPAHVARDPALVLEQLTAALPLDLIAAPSGYGCRSSRSSRRPSASSPSLSWSALRTGGGLRRWARCVP